MTKEELLKVLRSVIGEERGVLLCEIFDDSAGKSISLRYQAPAFDTLRYSTSDVLNVYKALQAAGLAGYSLKLYLVDATGTNRYFLEMPIASKRPIATAAEQAGNRWRVSVISPDDPIPDTKALFVDLYIVGGHIDLDKAETDYMYKLLAERKSR